MSTQISSWTLVIKKGGTVAETMVFRDPAGALLTWDTASIVVTPNGASEFSWTQANGKFVNSSPGTYDIALTAADTAAYAWTSGRYRLSTTLGSAVYPCYIEGKIFAEDC